MSHTNTFRIFSIFFFFGALAFLAISLMISNTTSNTVNAQELGDASSITKIVSHSPQLMSKPTQTVTVTPTPVSQAQAVASYTAPVITPTVITIEKVSSETAVTVTNVATPVATPTPVVTPTSTPTPTDEFQGIQHNHTAPLVDSDEPQPTDYICYRNETVISSDFVNGRVECQRVDGHIYTVSLR